MLLARFQFGSMAFAHSQASCTGEKYGLSYKEGYRCWLGNRTYVQVLTIYLMSLGKISLAF